MDSLRRRTGQVSAPHSFYFPTFTASTHLFALLSSTFPVSLNALQHSDTMEGTWSSDRLNSLSEFDVYMRNDRMIDPKLRFVHDLTEEQRNEASRRYVTK